MLRSQKSKAKDAIWASINFFKKQKLNNAKREQIAKIENFFHKTIEKNLKNYSYELSSKILDNPDIILALKEQNKNK